MGTLQSVQWMERGLMCQKSFHLQRGHQNFNALQKKGPKCFCFQQPFSTLPQQILYDQSLKETIFFGWQKYLKFSINQIVGPIIDGLAYLRFLKENLTAGEFLGLVFPLMSQNKNLQAIMVNIGKFKKKKRFKNFMMTFYR